jgi:hypothetical protein
MTDPKELAARLAKIEATLDAVLVQTTRTYGTVIKHGDQIDDLESWRDKMAGALIPISIASQILAGLIVSYLSK